MGLRRTRLETVARRVVVGGLAMAFWPAASFAAAADAQAAEVASTHGAAPPVVVRPVYGPVDLAGLDVRPVLRQSALPPFPVAPYPMPHPSAAPAPPVLEIWSSPVVRSQVPDAQPAVTGLPVTVVGASDFSALRARGDGAFIPALGAVLMDDRVFLLGGPTEGDGI